jgi:dihydrofolate synthase/folylpolyglutamate synthase
MTAFDYLAQFQWHGIQPGLERIGLLARRLGDPQHHFPSVHIAGTNGKGSVATMTATVLREAGLRVGLYTSPHLINFSERIRVDGIPISADDLARLTWQVRDAVEAADLAKQITFFELTTAIAFLYFAQRGIDIGVIETGLGGRFDATALVRPSVCAITTVDFDHEAYLGHTLAQIAYEKAGIIKPGVPVVVGALPEEAMAVVETVAAGCQSPLIRIGREIDVSGERPEQFVYERVTGSDVTRRVVSSPFLARYQIHNAAVAIGIIEQLQRQGMPISEAHLLDGIAKSRWDGRFSLIRTNPHIVLDGAHNPSAARALAESLPALDRPPQTERRGKHWLIFGVMRDKRIEGILDPLLAWADEVIFTRPNVTRAEEPMALVPYLPPGFPYTLHPSFSQAMTSVESRLGGDDCLLITGSLYLVGEAKAWFEGSLPSTLRGQY